MVRKPFNPDQPPKELRVCDFEVGGQELRVFSFPAARLDFADRDLTEAEAAVAALVVHGHSNAEIASVRGTAMRTVANQMAAIFHKLDVHSRRELAVRYACNVVREPAGEG